MNDTHYGWVINTHYDWINLVTQMEEKNPTRFSEFKYSKTIFYEFLDKLQHEQHLYD